MSEPRPSHPPPAELSEGGPSGRGASPWELDPEWQHAPREPVQIRPVIPIPAAAPVIAEKPVEEVSQPPREPYVPIVRRPPPAEAAQTSLWSALIVISMGLLFFVFIAWQYLSDSKHGADDDLRLKRPVDQVATVRSPEKIQRLLDSLIPLPTGTMPSSVPWLWDTPTLSRLVKSNSAALDNLRDLLEDEDWHTAHSDWHARDLGSDSRWSLVFILKQGEAAYLSRLQREEAAFVAAIDLAELSWRLEQLWAWPSFYSRALEGQERSSQSLAELLKNARLTEPLLMQFQRQYSICQPMTSVLEQALSAFYVHEKKLIFGADSGEPLDTMPGRTQLKRPGRLFFKPNTTLQLFIDHFRQLKMEVRAPLANTGLITVSDSATQHSQGYQPNSAGESYCAARIANYRSLPAQLGLARARSGLVLTLFAVRRCVAEQKTLPPTLDHLRPKYLLDIPVDPFSTVPLLYDIRRGWLWSVGIDLKSQGGAPTVPAMHDPTEPTVEIGIGIATATSR